MAINQLPPQAYTREMLSEAFTWLHKQPSGIRELATNADSLVSLYLQSRRRPISSLNQELQPPSAEAFKQDLKNLAQGMKQFDDPSPAEAQNTVTHKSPTTIKFSEPKLPEPKAFEIKPSEPKFSEAKSVDFKTYDTRTLEALRKTQALLNLSSENEALRALVSLGFEHIKNKLMP
jgi:hypothetical protein